MSNSDITAQLGAWAKTDTRGVWCGSSTGFDLPNGAQLGWLIDIENRSIEIYRPAGEAETRFSIHSLAGEGPV